MTQRTKARRTKRSRKDECGSFESHESNNDQRASCNGGKVENNRRGFISQTTKLKRESKGVTSTRETVSVQ